MDNSNDVIELLDILYSMVNEAWGVPLGNDKCIIEREKTIDIINEIKANLPTSIAEAKRLVSARDEFIGNAKREAESLRKNAEEQAAKMIDQQEIIRIATERSNEMITAAEKKSNELKRVASEYVDDVMRKAEECLNSALTTVRNTQGAFRSSGVSSDSPAKARPQAQAYAKAEPKSEPKEKVSGDIPLDIDLNDESAWMNK